ncbi:MAG: heme o synthase [Saprospiraceae bacterium]|nr:heme o synthase [Saprospiraceae bacterium]
MARSTTYTARRSVGQWIADVATLVKFRLTLLVVFSSVMAFAVAAGTIAQWWGMLILAIGGFLVAGASNAINQILERDYDILMERTADRPVASGRMQVSEAIAIAGFMLLFGIVALALFNPLTAFLGTLSFILYAFIYTPLKRYSTIAVAVGAIPGAMPALIGCVAFEGTVTWLAIVLFCLQFLWQFPHFWSIGWLSFDQYRNAGFKLVPARNGEVDPALGKNTLLYGILLLPVCVMSYLVGTTGLIVTLLLAMASLWYTYNAYLFYKDFDRAAARRLMFSSFAYLPLILLIVLIGALV